MKAIRIHEFGGPEVMKVEEVPQPVPQADELLVKVYACGVNPADYIVREGGNELLKPMLKLPLGLGLDAAGEVAAMGNNVSGFKVGDKVYGIPNFLDGTYAEYVAAKANQFARMPHHLNFNEAGALPSCALMAWNGIELGKAYQGQRVLVHAAAGGIGSLAMQFAKAKGAYVIATASQHNFSFLKELGADEVTDYRAPNFADALNNIDMVFDASPVRDEATRMAMAASLNSSGIFVSVQIAYPFSGEMLSLLAQKGATAIMIRRDIDASRALADIAALIDAGKVKVIVSKVYSMEQVADAHREVESKHVRGKVVLAIRKEN